MEILIWNTDPVFHFLLCNRHKRQRLFKLSVVVAGAADLIQCSPAIAKTGVNSKPPALSASNRRSLPGVYRFQCLLI
jgi:hypothetical protein